MVKGKASKTKKSYGKKRNYKKRKMMPKSDGKLTIVRCCPEFWLQNTTTAGVARLGFIGSGGTEVTYTGTNMTIGTPTLGMNGAYDIPFAMNFRLSDLISYSDIATLCDRYKLDGVEIKLYPSFTNNPISGLYNWPQFSYCIDRDDTAIVPVGSLREKQNLKTIRFNPNKPLVIRFKPSYNVGVYNNPQNATIEPSIVNTKSQFIDSTSVNIAHFGIKGYFGNMDLPATSTSKFGIKFDVRYKIIGAGFQ